MNVEKLMKRFPNGFNSEDSKKRVDTKEEKEIVTDLADNAYEFSKRNAKPIRMSKMVVAEALLGDDSEYPKHIQLMRQATREHIPANFTGIAVERSVQKPGYYEQINVIYSNEKPVKRVAVRLLEDGQELVEVTDIEERGCPQCVGTGNDNITGVECSMCSGTGNVIV
jgi:hypothetical protein